MKLSFAFFRGGSILTGAIGECGGSRTRNKLWKKCESTSAGQVVSGFYLDFTKSNKCYNLWIVDFLMELMEAEELCT